MMLNYNNLLRSLLVTIMLVVSFNATARTVWVSDQLNIAMRSGPTMSHRIVRFLPSGTQLEVLENSAEGDFVRARLDDGVEGWVKQEQVMNERSARDRLPQLTSKVAELRSLVKQLKHEGEQLVEQNRKLEQEKVALKELLDQLRTAAAEPIAIADKNRRLTEQLQKVDAENAELKAENERLADENIKEWFMIGGGVALLSLLFGLIIPSFSWGRKKNIWGGDF